MRRAALAVGVGVALLASTGMAAEPDVGVGGYHDAALRAAQHDLLSPAPDDDAAAGLVHVGISTDARSTLATFTPRFGGLGVGIGGGALPELGVGAGAGRGIAAPGPDRRLEFGLRDTSEIAGLAVDWSAKAGVGRGAPALADDPSAFVVGGELAVSGVRFDAAYGEAATALGLSGNHMTAGVAYGFGPLDARLGYSLVKTETESSLITLGSQLTLRPGLILQGDVAYAEEESSGDGATAGVVSLRFNF